MNATISGGCLCGAVRYELSTLPVDVGDCHCRDCQKSSGAPSVTWGVARRDDIHHASGELRRVAFAGRIRSVANCCGTPLFFEDSPDDATIEVTIASLDQPELFPPEKIIWVDDRLSWVPLDPLLPQYHRGSSGPLIPPERREHLARK